MNRIGLIAIVCSLILLTGPFYSLRYGGILDFIIIGGIYFLAVYGIDTMYKGGRKRNWGSLIIGYLSLLIAYFVMEWLT